MSENSIINPVKFPKIALIGGDLRFAYLYKDFLSDGLNISPFQVYGVNTNLNLDETLYNSSVVILPYPMSPDGVFINSTYQNPLRICELAEKIKKYNIKSVYAGAVTNSIKLLFDKQNICITDYALCEDLLIKNAICTSEGALEMLLRELDVTLWQSKITVLGYGRIGRIISNKLKFLGADVTATARKNKDFALMEADGIRHANYKNFHKYLSESKAVINTVPSVILNREELAVIPKDTIILELASPPGCIDRKSAENFGIKVIFARSLPGKTCPKTAAEIIKSTIYDIISETENEIQ